MKNTSVIITIDTQFSDCGEHRYVLRKVWDNSRPIPLVISKSAGFDNGILETTTQNILTNNLYALGYGGFCLCNLFSKVGGTATDDDNTGIIKALTADKEYKEIVIAWGNLSASKESIQEYATEIEKYIFTLKKKSILTVSDGTNLNCHPLSPSVRKHFELVPYAPGSEKTAEEDDKQ